MNKDAIIIFAKAPLKEHAKTRLAGHLTDEERLNFYESLLKGTVNKLTGLEGIDTLICYWPVDANNYFMQFGLKMYPQSDGDIGIRMFNALKKIFDIGYKKAVLVGVDVPEISSETTLTAFKMLDKKDIVFGPALDGGYYMIGMKRPLLEIFEGIDWSTEATLRQSMEKASEQSYSLAFTETLLDIDTPDDLNTYLSGK
jgi:rSAM/selenodomain-associated transferase 1